MTAEVAIINRQAIALAADSAVTINMLGKTKAFNSANKLFSLSSGHSVGIMIYGGAQLTGIPWETLIKVYRNQLSQIPFPKLTDYGEDFIKFIHDNFSFFREEDQLTSIRLSAYYKFFEIVNKVKGEIKKAFTADGQVSKNKTSSILRRVIDQYLLDLESLDYIEHFSEDAKNSILDNYRQELVVIAREVFEDLRLTEKGLDKLANIAANTLVKNEFLPNSSGVVIAGFGEKEVFPSLFTYEIECVFDKKLKYRKHPNKWFDNPPNSVIVPFAQEEMVFTFVGGINPHLEEMSRFFLDKTLKNYFDFVMEVANQTSSGRAETMKNKKGFDDLREKLIREFRIQTDEYKRSRHIDPILNTVSMLPKDELAAMAEALVSLTSLKRRVSTEAETVGGPTDVALISKGDGFVWVQRKHYFNAELNPDFFARRFSSMLASYQGGRRYD